MPNVNTVIINQADKFGLTQLYQLRGRVGRGTNLAYAYFLYEKGKHLTPTAQQRLRTIYQATELGAGFNIAMKDLEIRGAGTLLGTRQSGYISAVGFSLYCWLLAEAVEAQKARLAGAREKAAGPSPLPPPSVSLPQAAYIPEDYVPDIETRLGLYQRLVKLETAEQITTLAQEFNDRFGAPPEEVANLLYAVRIKLLAARAGIESISTEHGQIILRRFEGMPFDKRKLEPVLKDGITVGVLRLTINPRRLGAEWQKVLEEVLGSGVTQLYTTDNSEKKRGTNMNSKETKKSRPDLRVNAERLWSTIMETAKFGGTEKGGVCRLTLTDTDRQVRDWFVSACESIGCTVTIDEMGTIFARRAGKDNSLPPIAIGSHLDTQPTGGKFDGILGVLSGLEVLRTLNDTGYETNAPLEVIDWTNEEGSRFTPPMMASGVFTSIYQQDWVYAIKDRDGKEFGKELARIGYRGNVKCGDHALGAYFELHIEQGPVLETENKMIGVVLGMQGQSWYEVTVTGRESHAGSTPIRLRKDALLASARMIEAVHQVALDHAPLAVSTVGLVEVRPNSRNVIPGSVFFTVDLRHPEDSILQEMDRELKEAVEKAARDTDVEVKLKNNWSSPSVKFDEECISEVRAAAEALEYRHRDIVSGAGHDAAYIARVAPTAMIFIPCRNGISHNEIEKTEPEQVAAGANVLLKAVLGHDSTQLIKKT
jgi:N-carbamoyl-L-amino-acid hydrolase